MKLNLFSLSILLGLSACECNDIEPSNPEDIFNNLLVYTDSKIIATSRQQDAYAVTLFFSRPIDHRSAVIGKSIILQGFKASTTLEIRDNTLEFQIQKTECAPPCERNVTLKGNGDSPLKSMGGIFLDGDRNGLPGGDFIIKMN